MIALGGKPKCRGEARSKIVSRGEGKDEGGGLKEEVTRRAIFLAVLGIRLRAPHNPERHKQSCSKYFSQAFDKF